MGFRDYSPGLNRYLTRDCYNGALADLNLALDPFTGSRYAFAGGNPITGIELDGHMLDNDGGGGGGGTPTAQCTDEYGYTYQCSQGLTTSPTTQQKVEGSGCSWNPLSWGTCLQNVTGATPSRNPAAETPTPETTAGGTNCWIRPASCLFEKLGRGTYGVCVNAGAALVFNLSGELCVHTDKEGVFFTATGATPPNNEEPVDWSDGSYGMGAGAGVKIEISNAQDKNSLAGPFSFGEGSLGPVQGGYAWGQGAQGEDVWVGSGGYSVGIPSGSGGVSHTAVSGYLFEWCGWWIC